MLSVRLESVNWRAALPVVALVVIVASIFLVILYVRQTSRASVARDNLDSRRQDQALCFVLNENREETRKNTLVLYKLVVAVLAGGGPESSQTAKVFFKAERKLSKRLEALRPINCETFVRPELPLPSIVP